MRCVICKREYSRGTGITRFWRDYTFHLCGDKKCMDGSWLKILERLVKDGILENKV